MVILGPLMNYVLMLGSLRIAQAQTSCSSNPILVSPNPCNTDLNTVYTETVAVGSGTKTISLNQFFENSASPPANSGYVSKTIINQNGMQQCNNGLGNLAAYGCGQSVNAIAMPYSSSPCSNIDDPAPGYQKKCSCLVSCSQSLTFSQFEFGTSASGVNIQNTGTLSTATVDMSTSTAKTYTFSIRKLFTQTVLPLEKQFVIIVSNVAASCSQDLQPISATKTFSKQKNSGTITLITTSEFSSNQVFAQPSNGACAISDWFLSDEADSTNAAVTSGTIYTKMLISSKAAGVDDVKVDTTVADIKAYEYRMKLWVYQGTGAYKKLNPTPMTISVTVGCINQQSLVVSQASSPPSNLKQYASDKVQIKFPRTSSVSQVTETFDLSQYVTFSQSTAGCGAYKLEMFSDSNRLQPTGSTSSIYFTAGNPTIMDSTTFIVDQRVTFKYDSTTTSTINAYLKVTPRGPSPQTTSYQIDVQFCNNQPQALSSLAFTVTYGQTLSTDQSQPLSEIFSALYISEVVCQGIEYIIETNPVNTAAAFTSIVGTSLVTANPSAQTAGQYTLTLTMISTKSVKSASRNIIIDIQSSACQSTVTAVSPTVTINFQKNKQVSSSYVRKAKTIAEIKAMWDATMQQSNCNFIYQWFYAADTDTSGTPLASGTVYDRLRTSSSTGDMIVNSQATVDETLTFKVYIKTSSARILNMNPVTVTLYVDCVDETLLNFYDAKSGLQTAIQYYSSVTGTTKMTFEFPKLTSGSSSVTIKLSDLIARTTDYTFCSPHSFTGYSDSGLLYLTTGSSVVRPSANPTNWDTSTGNIDVDIVIAYDSSTAALASLFLQSDIIKKSDNTNKYEIEAKFCQRTVSLKGANTLDLSRADSALTVDLTAYFQEDNPQAYPTACIGHEYMVDNLVTVSGTPMVAAEITFSADTMTLPTGKIGKYTFDLWIVASKSQNKVKIAVTLGLNYCLVLPTAVWNPRTMNVQKNKIVSSSYIQTMYNFATIKDFWSSTMRAVPNCEVEEWFIADKNDATQTPLAAGNAIFDRLQSPTVTGNMVIDSKQDATDATIQVKVYSRVGLNKLINTNGVLLTIQVGCKDETLGGFYTSKSTASSLDYFYSANNQQVILRVPKLEKGTNSIALKLSDLIDRKIDYEFCGPQSFKGYSDFLLNTLITSSDAVQPKVNPSTWVASTGLIDVDIQVTYDSTTASLNLLYLLSDVATSSFQTKYLVWFTYCVRSVSLKGANTLTLNKDDTDFTVDLTIYFKEDSPIIDAKNCAGHEYRIDNFQVVVGMPITVDMIKFQDDIMTVPIGKSGQYTFDLWIVASKSLNKVKIAVTLYLGYSCPNSQVVPLKSPLELYAQKNKRVNGLTQVTLVEDITTLFSVPAEVDTCALKSWFLTPLDQFTKIPDSDPIAIQMLQVGRAIALDAMKINSAYTQSDTTVKFMLRVYLHSNLEAFRVLNKNPLEIRVNVGCYEEKLKTYWNKKTGATDPEGLISYDKQVMKFIFAVPLQAETKSINLASYFELSYDFDQCGAFRVTSFSDQAYTTKTIAGTASGLVTNPSERSGGLISASMNIIAAPTNLPTSSIYLVAETDSYNAKNVKSVVTVVIDMCSDEPKPVSADAVVILEGKKDPIKLLPLFKFTPAYDQCKGYEFMLSTTPNPVSVSIPPLTIANDELQITSLITFQQDFYVVMRSTKSTKFGAVKISTIFSSKPAQFTVPLPTTEDVKVTKSASGQLQETPEYLFTSSKGIHPTNKDIKVKLMVAWVGTAPAFGKISVMTDTFEVKLDRTKITKSETVKISVKLAKEYEDISKVVPVSVSFNVVFFQSLPEPAVKTETVSQPETVSEVATKNETKQVEAKTETANSTANSTATGKDEIKPVKGDFVQGPVVPAWQKKSSAADVAAFWNGQKKSDGGNKKDKEDKQRKFQPLKYTVDFRRNGTMFVVFNQNIVVPQFDKENATNAKNVSNSTSETHPKRRQLLAMSEINVARDLFDIQFDIFNEAAQGGKLEYFVDLVGWNEMELILQFNFSKPLIISQGEALDKLYIKIKDRKQFVAKETGQEVEENYSKKELVALVPKQLPSNIDAESTESTMNNSKNMMLTIMIIQIVLQFILNQSVNTIIDLLLAMQMLVYIKEFDLNMPALVEMLLDQFKSLIEFDALNPESIAKMFMGEDFTFVGFITGKEETIVNEDQKVSIVSDLMVYIFAVVVLAVISITMALLYRFGSQKIREKISTKLTKFKQSMMWNDTILSYRVAHFTTAIAAGDQFKLRLKDSLYQDSLNYIVAIIAFVLMTVFIIYISIYLLYNYEKLPGKVDRIGMLFPNISYFRSKMYVLRYPLFMLHRMLYVLFASVFLKNIIPAIQLLNITTLFYTAFRFANPPSLPKTEVWLERFTDLSLHMILLQLLLFTDYVPEPEVQFMFSFLYIGTFCTLFIIYIGTIIRMSVRSLLRMRRLKKIKQHKIEAYKQQKLKEERELEKSQFQEMIVRETQARQSLQESSEDSESESSNQTVQEDDTERGQNLDLVQLKSKKYVSIKHVVMRSKIDEMPEEEESDNQNTDNRLIQDSLVALNQNDQIEQLERPCQKIFMAQTQMQSGFQSLGSPPLKTQLSEQPRRMSEIEANSFSFNMDQEDLSQQKSLISHFQNEQLNEVQAKPDKSQMTPFQKLLAKKSVKLPDQHPLENVINEQHLIPGIRKELHPGLTHRYSDIKSLTRLSLVAIEISNQKSEIKRLVKQYLKDNKDSDKEALEKIVNYNLLLIDIEFKMRLVDMICQRDILLKDFKERHLGPKIHDLVDKVPDHVSDQAVAKKDTLKNKQ